MNSLRYVTVPVTALWTSPTAPRDVDAAAVARKPDVVAWLADLDAAQARPGLHGRILTQLELGEPVQITSNPDGSREGVTEGATDGWPDGSADKGWLQIVAPMQPSSLDVRGYPGWVLAEHVSDQVPDRFPLSDTALSDTALSDTGDSLEAGTGLEAFLAQAFITQARKHLGLPYLWGGMCDWGLDCSGLVALSLRRLGVVVPRDADDQYDACEHISADDARPGDLFFFAREGKRPHHVGIVTGLGRMLHAPETGSLIVEEPLTPARQHTLIGAGRLSSLRAPTRLPS